MIEWLAGGIAVFTFLWALIHWLFAVHKYDSASAELRTSHQLAWISFSVVAAILSAALLMISRIDKMQVSAPASQLSLATIEQILSERLPDSAILEERHQHLLQALKNQSVSTPNVGISITYIGFGLIAAFLLAGAFAAWSAFPNARLVVGSLFILGGTGFAIDHFAKFGLFEKLIGELFVFNFNGERALEAADVRLSIELGDSGFNVECPTKYNIGPFLDARNDQLEEGSIDDQVSLLANDVTSKRQQRKLAALLIVGSADKRGLSGTAAISYGSNAGLAQVRAHFVKTLIEKRLNGLIPTTLILSTGPSIIISTQHMTKSESRGALAGDRHVQVCAVWGF